LRGLSSVTAISEQTKSHFLKILHFLKYIQIFSYFFRFLEKEIVFPKISEKKCLITRRLELSGGNFRNCRAEHHTLSAGGRKARHRIDQTSPAGPVVAGGGTTSPQCARQHLPQPARPEGCYAARRSPLRGKAGLASQCNYGPDREVDDSLGGPTAGAADQLDRTTWAASPRPHPNGTQRVTVDMTGSDPGRRRSVDTYRRNRPLNVRGRVPVTPTIHSLQL
jgi:hypothetical protein